MAHAQHAVAIGGVGTSSPEGGIGRWHRRRWLRETVIA